MKHLLTFVILLISFSLSAQSDAEIDIIKKGKELDRLQGALQFDVTDNGEDTVNTDGQQAPKKPKMVDIGTGLKSINWSPDKRYKRVPLEKLNPYVYTKEQMEDFRKEYQKWWEKEENTSLILLVVAAAIIFLFFLVWKKF